MMRRVVCYVPSPFPGKTIFHLKCGHWGAMDDARMEEGRHVGETYFCRMCESERRQKSQPRADHT